MGLVMRSGPAMKWDGGRVRRWAACFCAASCLAAVLGLSSSVLAFDSIDTVEGYRFVFEDVDARRGETVEMDVSGLHESSVQGFTLVATYPSEHLTIERVHNEDSILEAIEIDFWQVNVHPDEGFLSIGALVDITPPFDGELIPNIGCALRYLTIEATVGDEAEGELAIALEDNLGFPPLTNLFAIDNDFVAVSEMTRGVISVPALNAGFFLRGDANLDGTVDVSDPVAILEDRFLGRFEILCKDAADADDNERLQLTDVVYLLNYLFQGGPIPPAPSFEPGPDPQGLALDCLLPGE